MLLFRTRSKAVVARAKLGIETGLSLVELVIVVVVLGALIAIAIPLFASIRTSSDQNALLAAAADGAIAVTLVIATDDDASIEDAAASAGSDNIATSNVGSETEVRAVCVRAEGRDGRWAQAGTAANCKSNSWTEMAPAGF